MGIHINLKEEKVVRLNVREQKHSDLTYKERKVEMVATRCLGIKLYEREVLIQSEGWHDKESWNIFSDKAVKKMIEKGQYKIIDGELFTSANIIITTSENNTFHEYFESDEDMLDRLHEIKEIIDGDFLCVKND